MDKRALLFFSFVQTKLHYINEEGVGVKLFATNTKPIYYWCVVIKIMFALTSEA